MAEYIVNKEVLVDIADTIREKNNISNKLSFPAGFSDNIKPSDLYTYLSKSITSYSNSDITSIRGYSFQNCNKLNTIDLPLVETIGKYAFQNCTSLKSINLPSVTSIGYYTFSNCNYLVSIDLPLVTSIGEYGFSECDNLTTINLPLVTSLGTSAFSTCTKLNSVNLPSVTSIKDFAFSSCYALTSIDLPSATYLGNVTFNNCSSLKTVNIPLVTSLGSNSGNGTFKGCITLESIDLPSVTNIKSYAFQNCTSLDTVILRSETMCTLYDAADKTFSNTPIANGTGYIYVPNVLLDTYKADSKWSKLSNQLRAIEKGGINNIKNKVMLFNTTQSIETNWQPSLETPDDTISNIQVTSSDETAVTVSNVANADNTITFDINSLAIEGTYTITISATIGEDIITNTFDVTVCEIPPEPTYTVETVTGASYGFTLNSSSGYYVSQNKGKNSTAAVCKLAFTTYGQYNMYLDCINNGESNYDYGILSNLDTTLVTTSTVDATNVFKSFKGLSSTSVQTVDYGIPTEGEHFIYIKFRKDSSSSSGNDTLQFKVRFELPE